MDRRYLRALHRDLPDLVLLVKYRVQVADWDTSMISPEHEVVHGDPDTVCSGCGHVIHHTLTDFSGTKEQCEAVAAALNALPE